MSAGSPRLPQSEYRKAGRLAIVDQGQKLVAGYTDDVGARARASTPLIVFGDHTRAVKYVDFPFAVGAEGVKLLGVRDSFEPRYVYHFLRAHPVPANGYARHFKFLKEMLLPKPPLSEQRRIAAILDKTDSIRNKRRQILARLDALTQSIFHDMFGDPNHSQATERFGDVASLVGGRNLVADDPDARSDFRVLKISAVTSERFRPEESKPLPLGYVPPSEHLVRAGDLLISRANTAELVGAVALVESEIENTALPDKIWRFVWLDDQRVPRFYRALLRTPSMRRRISQLASGTGGSMKNISKAKLEDLLLPSVPLGRQLEFERRARSIPTASAEPLDSLFTALQSRAFKGEL